MVELSGIYGDALHYDLLAQMTAPDDLPLYRRLVAEHGGPVLELGCGTGRIALELARSGVEVVGVDIAEPLLAGAREKARATGVEIELVLGDVRELDLGRRFPLVVFPYNGFNHMIDHQSITRCLGAAKRHLGDDGLLMVDTFNPDPTQLVPEGEAVILRYVDPRSLKKVVLTEHSAYDAARQVNTVTWRYDIGGEQDARIDVIETRIFFPQELDALFVSNGLRIVDKMGDYDGSPFTSKSRKQLVLAAGDRE